MSGSRLWRDVFVVIGLSGRMANLIDIRKDDLGLALAAERQPRWGRSSATTSRRQQEKDKATHGGVEIIDMDGAPF
ncbi:MULTISPECIES: DNA-binding protein [Komagataeibacter]|nr:DNA-binding protein [Komagataeibacter europaeus]ARW18402.1 hypothetical protein S101446_03328 [Komagataeibacter europaeus]